MAKKPRKLYGLCPESMRRRVRDFVDYDYVNSLSPEEKVWLDKFSREYYLASLDKDGKDIHTPDKYSKALYNANNARNRDIWNNEWRASVDDFISDKDSADDK